MNLRSYTLKKIRGNPNQSTTGMIQMGQRSAFYWYDHLSALCVCICVCVCVPSLGLEDIIGHIEALATFISFKW